MHSKIGTLSCALFHKLSEYDKDVVGVVLDVAHSIASNETGPVVTWIKTIPQRDRLYAPSAAVASLLLAYPKIKVEIEMSVGGVLRQVQDLLAIAGVAKRRVTQSVQWGMNGEPPSSGDAIVSLRTWEFALSENMYTDVDAVIDNILIIIDPGSDKMARENTYISQSLGVMSTSTRIIVLSDDGIQKRFPGMHKEYREIVLLDRAKPPAPNPRQEAVTSILGEMASMANDLRNVANDMRNMTDAVAKLKRQIDEVYTQTQAQQHVSSIPERGPSVIPEDLRVHRRLFEDLNGPEEPNGGRSSVDTNPPNRSRHEPRDPRTIMRVQPVIRHGYETRLFK